ncbi:MAG: hypothetical protein ABIT71_27215 [Vicinamibacteraceae bacterium]
MAGKARAAARVLVVTRVSAPRALVLVEDGAGGELPLSIPGQLVAATASSIAVGCAASATTELTIRDIGYAENPAGLPVFDGQLTTPTRTLAVRTVLGATLLEVVVPTTDTRVRIWANTPAEPTALTIGVARAAAGIAR